MLQNETNPRSVAPSVWKWQPNEQEGVMENLPKMPNLAYFVCLTLTVN